MPSIKLIETNTCAYVFIKREVCLLFLFSPILLCIFIPEETKHVSSAKLIQIRPVQRQTSIIYSCLLTLLYRVIPRHI